MKEKTHSLPRLYQGDKGVGEDFGFIAASSSQAKDAVPIVLVNSDNLEGWLADQPDRIKQWIKASNFKAQWGASCTIPDEQGCLKTVLLSVGDFLDTNSPASAWAAGSLPYTLPEGAYTIQSTSASLKDTLYLPLFLAWGMGYYKFTRYKKTDAVSRELDSGLDKLPKVYCVLPESFKETTTLFSLLSSTYWVRDLINTPMQDLGPSQLADVIVRFAKDHKADIEQITGKDLLKYNYPAIYAVGKASDNPPRLVKLTWGNKNHPKLVLVGKGVCFDTGGLNLKSMAGMRSMKKDMGGAAHVLGLAQLIIAHQLPVRLCVLTPLVENAVGAGAYRPDDILSTRKGFTVEVGNTDAEGRLILADALAEACESNPDLVIDFSTLTGAARVALGPDVGAFFTTEDDIAQGLMNSASTVADPLWQLPLYAPYRKFLDSKCADMNNISSESYGGAITAALFLQTFVEKSIPWVHFDVMAWNSRALPSRPEGGEAMGMRAVFDFLRKRYG